MINNNMHTIVNHSNGEVFLSRSDLIAYFKELKKADVVVKHPDLNEFINDFIIALATMKAVS
jgi:hypothetical protein